MTLNALLGLCLQRQREQNAAHAAVYVTFDAPDFVTRKNIACVVLLGRGGPVGEIQSVGEDQTVRVRYWADDVVKWLDVKADKLKAG